MTSRLVYVGPVALDALDLQCRWTSSVGRSGTRSASLQANVPWSQAQQLSELAGNEDRSVTASSFTGVLEYVWAGDGERRAFNGWYLLQSVDISADGDEFGMDLDSLVQVTIGAVCFGDRQPVVVRSSRARANSFSLGGSEVLAAPLTVSDGNSGWAAEPGGTAVARAFDAAHGAGVFDRVVDARTMAVRVGVIGTLSSPVAPAVEDDAKPPSWVAARGGDCRVYDLSEGREVYGPSHPLEEPSDLMLDNGLTRWWLGGRGIVPYFTVMAFAGGAWHQCGCVALADETTGPQLDGARLVSVTPDGVIAALRVRGLGEIFVTLRRGERMLRVQHGSTRAPAISATRAVTWLGTPPTVDGIGAGVSSSAGEFGGGLDPGSEIVEFQWPSAADADAWSVRAAWLPGAGSESQPSSGVWTIIDDAADGAVELGWDASDAAMVVRYGGGSDELRSAPITFDAAEPVRAAVYFDTRRGLGLTVRTVADGTLVAVDASIVTPASEEAFARLGIWGAAEAGTEFGDLAFGEGPFGDFVAIAGAVDEIVVFAGRLSAAQASVLVEQDVQLAGVTSDPRPVWYAAFDTDPVPVADAVASGRRVESSADDVGFKRVAGGLAAVVAQAPAGVRSSSSVTLADLFAGFATAATADAAADLHDQFAAASAQEIRIR